MGESGASRIEGGVDRDWRETIAETEKGFVSIGGYPQEGVDVATATRAIGMRGVKNGDPVIHGSGYCVQNAEGDLLIVTNRHVVDAGTSGLVFRVRLPNGMVLDAEVDVMTPMSDVAILRIQKPEGFDSDSIKTLSFGDSKSIKRGQPIFALGNARGFHDKEPYASTGIISGRVNSDNANRFGTGLEDVFTSQLNTHPGSSGGPVCDTEGNVIGMTAAGLRRGPDMTLIIPADEIQPLVEYRKEFKSVFTALRQLISARDEGGALSEAISQAVIELNSALESVEPEIRLMILGDKNTHFLLQRLIRGARKNRKKYIGEIEQGLGIKFVDAPEEVLEFEDETKI